MAKPRTVISIVAMTVARRSAAIFEQLRLLLATANFGRILSDRQGQELENAPLPLGRNWAGNPFYACVCPGWTRQAPRTAATGDLEGAAE